MKSLSGRWNIDYRSAAAMSEVQFATALQKGPDFWLYVVEEALTSDRPPYRIQDPARRVDQFLYDEGWRAIAEDDTSQGEPQSAHGTDESFQALQAQVQSIVFVLLEMGAPRPEVAHEVIDASGDSRLLEAAWPGAKVGITLNPDTADDGPLVAIGWDVRLPENWSPDELLLILGTG